MEINNLPDLREHGWKHSDTNDEFVWYDYQDLWDTWTIKEFSDTGEYVIFKNNFFKNRFFDFETLLEFLKTKKLIK